jgi:hypothetical protein
MTKSDEWAQFEPLPDEARVWIQGFSRTLTREAGDIVRERMEAFLSIWASHGNRVHAAWKTVEDRFLVTAAHCETGLSGCGIDAYFRVLKGLRDQDGIDALDRGLVFHRREDGAIQATHHLEFFTLVEKGEAGPGTLVFDTLVETLGDLRKNRFELPFEASWHSRTYGPEQAVRS